MCDTHRRKFIAGSLALSAIAPMVMTQGSRSVSLLRHGADREGEEKPRLFIHDASIDECQSRCDYVT
jgi:hypothetical protein